MAFATLIHEVVEPENKPYRAVSGQNEAMGQTACETLDALAAQPETGHTDTFVIVRTMTGDACFTTEQIQRMQKRLAIREHTRQNSADWNDTVEAELQQLVDAELKAATLRAEAHCRDLGR